MDTARFSPLVGLSARLARRVGLVLSALLLVAAAPVWAQDEEDDLYMTPSERRKATEAANQSARREAERLQQQRQQQRAQAGSDYRESDYDARKSEKENAEEGPINGADDYYYSNRIRRFDDPWAYRGGYFRDPFLYGPGAIGMMGGPMGFYDPFWGPVGGWGPGMWNSPMWCPRPGFGTSVWIGMGMGWGSGWGWGGGFGSPWGWGGPWGMNRWGAGGWGDPFWGNPYAGMFWGSPAIADPNFVRGNVTTRGGGTWTSRNNGANRVYNAPRTGGWNTTPRGGTNGGSRPSVGRSGGSGWGGGSSGGSRGSSGSGWNWGGGSGSRSGGGGWAPSGGGSSGGGGRSGGGSSGGSSGGGARPRAPR